MDGTISSVIAVLAAYLIGSVDFAVVVSRRFGLDIYEHGSGNPGTSNVFRTLGKKAAGAVMVGDALKGLVAAAIGSAVGGPTLGVVCALAATMGHVAPVWHGFRGGRGVATAIGGAIWLTPPWGVLLALAWVAVVVITKTASVASLGAMALYVPVFWIDGHTAVRLLWAALIAGLVIWRHKANIGRILARNENRIAQ